MNVFERNSWFNTSKQKQFGKRLSKRAFSN